ncbi:hypothetical protein D9619_012343 [Psilocybe cf. subviscida]|uniref:P-loop containing nucleoside triphosphate hydrolase protein n=1 Tax=Psilocybe cf. subviscida TaxID=2480587 RepID=A0A8H5ARX6_9AGAR|nr:hypothetical protein D9619_012343 [Psilocybe cf. subviscida]
MGSTARNMSTLIPPQAGSWRETLTRSSRIFDLTQRLSLLTSNRQHLMDHQEVLVPQVLRAGPRWILENTLVIPVGVAALCLSYQLLHICIGLLRSANNAPAEQLNWRQHLDHLGGWKIVAFSTVRLLGSIALAILSLVKYTTWTNPTSWMALTFLYSSALGLLSLISHKWGLQATRINIFLLLVTLSVFVYRDIWPLATYEQVPVDAAVEGPLFWAKFAILTIIALVVPLFIPRKYVPVDPKNPMPEPNAEQTTSLWGFLFFNYLTPVITSASRVKHLEVDQMPPLMDTDASKNLIAYAFPHLDPYRGAKKRHIFFGLMRVFRFEYTAMALDIAGYSLAGFITPLAIYRLLGYMEAGPGRDFIRPWFWIFALFAGALSRTVLFQNYIFYATRALAHTESLLTQLIFEHSLRIRLTSQANEEEKPTAIASEAGSTVAGTPETASIADSSTSTSGNGNESETEGAHSQSATAVSTDGTDSTISKSSVAKGKGKDTSSSTGSPAPAPKKDEKKDEKDKDKEDNLVGKINNLVTTDLGNIIDSRDFLFLLISVPLQVGLSIAFLYTLLGWSAFAGLASMIILLPLPGYATKLLHSTQKTRMKKTDARVQKTTEVVSVLKMVKLFGWENKMLQQIQDARNDELKSVFKLKVLESLTGILNGVLPIITMIITYAIYTGVMKQQLNASVIFSTLNVFNTLRNQLFNVSWQITQATTGKVSLDRVNSFLKETELLDAYVQKSDTTDDVVIPALPGEENDIGFRNASFSWSGNPTDGSITPSRRAYRLRIDGEVKFKGNSINLIIGPTGSGKTSILMALLGEMHFIPLTADSWFNLPREQGVAYASQESWVQNETIRDNILFGQPYDEERYNKVLRQTSLDKDLELFEAGDKTEVGEKGITLSGGQKARVTLARAIYSTAKLILLDDILAALDVHTASWIVEKCLKGDLVRGRTVLLVTHNVALISPIAQFIVSIGSDGVIKTQGNDIDIPLVKDDELATEVEIDKEILERAKEEIPGSQKKDGAPSGVGKLILAEEIAQGHVTWKSVKLFLTALGGDYPLVFFSLWICGFLFVECISAFSTWFLGYWGTHYLGIYSGIVVATISLNNLSYFLYVYGTLRASRRINSMLISSVLTSTLRWLDETPAARIIARCTQDIRMIDGPLASGLFSLTSVTLTMFTSISVVIIFAPIFFFPGIAVASLGAILGNIYLKAQLSSKREQSNAKSPVLAHFSAAIAGIVSIRAYGAQAAFKAEASKRIDHYTRISRLTYNLNRWIGSRIDNIGNVYYAALACYLVYGPSIGSSNTGFTLNMASDFCTMILWWVRIFNDFEVQSNSLERIQGYIEIDHEPPATESGKPPAAWPTSGDLVVENLSARYSQDGPTVLHSVSFHIKSGERVGVVGRTGSGKSSLTLSLLRCIVTEGTVYFDGVPTNTINLDALRSNVTIIPQAPELLSGTLRKNLDPFEQHDDAALNDALRSAGLFLLQDELGESRITLDSNITSGGGNLSVGEKQILALARAMLRRSKLLILDEATSAIDYKTDNVIQTTLRHQLDPDVTVITVAHRLQTIMDANKIIVLDAGRVAEFDSPAALLKKNDGFFKALVDGSGDKDVLYEMAGKKSVPFHAHA